MRRYLERLAAAAIVPGGSFHPMLGSVYQREVDGLGAEGTSAEQPRAERSRGLEAVGLRENAGRGEPVEVVSQEEEPVPQVEGLGDRAIHRSLEADVEGNGQPSVARASRENLVRKLAGGGVVPDAEASVLQGLEEPVSRDAGRGAASDERDARGIGAAQGGGGAPEAFASAESHVAGQTGDVAGQTGNAAADAGREGLWVGRPRESARSVVRDEADKGVEGEPGGRVPTSSPLAAQAGSAAAGTRGEVVASSPLGSSRGASALASALAPVRASEAQPSGYEPLVAADAPARVRFVGGASGFPHGAVRASVQREGPGGREQTPQREADEIQIHIGRIEVTAVAPAPVARTQPVAMRKTPSLDDYLRRGTGRG